MTIVVILTLLTIGGVTTIAIRIRALHRVESNPGSLPETSLPSNFWRHKRMSWMDPVWMQHTLKVSRNNENSVNTQTTSVYNCVNTSEDMEDMEDIEQGEDGNHYAYIDIMGGVRDERKNTFGYR